VARVAQFQVKIVLTLERQKTASKEVLAMPINLLENRKKLPKVIPFFTSKVLAKLAFR